MKLAMRQSLLTYFVVGESVKVVEHILEVVKSHGNHLLFLLKQSTDVKPLCLSVKAYTAEHIKRMCI